MPNQIYKWMGSSPTSAKIVSRIPFQHPVQIYNILQVRRGVKPYFEEYALTLVFFPIHTVSSPAKDV